MATSIMTRCETRRLFKINGVKEARWVDVAVADLAQVDAPQIRCSHCHGAVKLVNGNDERGTEAHVKHRLREDSDNCQGAQGSAGLSSRPIK
jgi:hypothetical protein